MKKDEKSPEKYQQISLLLDGFVEKFENFQKTHQQSLLNSFKKAKENFQKLKKEAQFESSLQVSLEKIENSLANLDHAFQTLPTEVIKSAIELKNNLWPL